MEHVDLQASLGLFCLWYSVCNIYAQALLKKQKIMGFWLYWAAKQMKMRTHKHIIYWLVFFGFSLYIPAQSGIAGVYKTSDDFINRTLSHAGKNTKLKTHDTFHKELFVVKYHDSTFSYLKKDLFGYRTKDGQNFRFFENRNYPILNPTEPILIYVVSSGTGMRNSPFTEQYYFSRTASSNILPLSLKTLEIEFADNLEFTKLLSVYFKPNDSLSEYDRLHHIYKINRLFELSQHQILNEK
jgi:hypothetical protein